MIKAFQKCEEMFLGGYMNNSQIVQSHRDQIRGTFSKKICGRIYSNRSLKTYSRLDTQETAPKWSRGHYAHIHPRLQINGPCLDFSEAHVPFRHKRRKVKVSVVIPKADRPNTVVLTQLLSHLSRPTTMDNKYCSTTMDKWSHIDHNEAHVPPQAQKKSKGQVSVVLPCCPILTN